MNVWIACGGTGGHLFPGLAVAETLAARQHRVKLLVSEKAVDQAALSAWTNNSADLSKGLDQTPNEPFNQAGDVEWSEISVNSKS